MCLDEVSATRAVSEAERAFGEARQAISDANPHLSAEEWREVEDHLREYFGIDPSDNEAIPDLQEDTFVFDQEADEFPEPPEPEPVDQEPCAESECESKSSGLADLAGWANKAVTFIEDFIQDAWDLLKRIYQSLNNFLKGFWKIFTDLGAKMIKRSLKFIPGLGDGLTAIEAWLKGENIILAVIAGRIGSIVGAAAGVVLAAFGAVAGGLVGGILFGQAGAVAGIFTGAVVGLGYGVFVVGSKTEEAVNAALQDWWGRFTSPRPASSGPAPVPRPVPSPTPSATPSAPTASPTPTPRPTPKPTPTPPSLRAACASFARPALV